jgi:cytochrome P450
MMTDHGRVIMLPADYIEAVNEKPELSLTEYMSRYFLSSYETFRSFRELPPGMLVEAVMKGVTRSLPKFTKPLSLEMDACLSSSWGTSTEWHEVDINKDIQNFVARLSSRIFLGEDFARNPEWIRLNIEYTVNTFIAVSICGVVPAFIRPLLVQWLPICRKVRKDYAGYLRILKPVLADREAEIELARSENRAPNVPDDAIEWFRAASHGREYDPCDAQIGLQVTAIHTSSDLLCQAVLNLCAYPEYVEPLREEAITVLKTHGWQKVALTELRLLDSFFKETQRLKPIAMATLHRYATKDVTLSNGTFIAKGEVTGISSHSHWDPEIYPEPEKFDGYRFLNRRKIPGQENRSLLVSTSNEHTAFAHGKHACTGRFFAANEVKIAMVHLVLKYDMKIESPEVAKWKTFGITMFVNPEAKVQVRRRKEEVDMEALAREL